MEYRRSFISLAMLLIVNTLLITGCTQASNGKSVQTTEPTQQTKAEHPSTTALSKSINKLKLSVEDIENNSLQASLLSYEAVWQDMQAEYDTLRKSASVQPIDKAQLDYIKERLATLKQDLLKIEENNSKLQNSINELTKEITAAQNSIKLLETTWTSYKEANVKDARFKEQYIQILINSSKSSIINIQNQIKNVVQQANMHNGRAKGLVRSADKYVGTLSIYN